MNKFIKMLSEVSMKQIPKNDPFVRIHFDCDSMTFVGTIGMRCDFNFSGGERTVIPPEIYYLLFSGKLGYRKWKEELHEYPALKKAKGVVKWVEDAADENQIVHAIINSKTLKEVIDEITDVLTLWNSIEVTKKSNE